MSNVVDLLCIAWTEQDKDSTFNTAIRTQRNTHTLPCPAGRHSDVAYVASFNDIMKRFHLKFKKCQLIIPSPLDIDPRTVSAIGVSLSKRWPTLKL